jgi:hypothetical protein
MWRALVVVACCAVVGCAPGKVSVEGKVQWADGTPATELAGSVVMVEMKDGKPPARAAVAADGTFNLGTEADGDGVPPGDYRVAIEENRPVLKETPEGEVIQAAPKMDPKYGHWNTSGLTAKVAPGSNTLTLTVERVGKKKR